MKNKRGIFIQDNGMFGDEILVSFGMTTDEVSKALRKRKDVIKGIADWILEVKKEERKNDNGWIYVNDDKCLCWLSLPKWDSTWKAHEVLLHECVHLMQFCKRRKQFNDDETEAYLVEYLFKSIRKKLPQHGKDNR